MAAAVASIRIEVKSKPDKRRVRRILEERLHYWNADNIQQYLLQRFPDDSKAMQRQDRERSLMWIGNSPAGCRVEIEVIEERINVFVDHEVRHPSAGASALRSVIADSQHLLDILLSDSINVWATFAEVLVESAGLRLLKLSNKAASRFGIWLASLLATGLSGVVPNIIIRDSYENWSSRALWSGLGAAVLLSVIPVLFAPGRVKEVTLRVQ